MSLPTDAVDHEILEDEDLPHAHAALLLGDQIPPTLDEERRALMELFHATQGPHWDNNSGWGTRAPIAEWHGVIVDEQGRVAELRLNKTRLKGSLPEPIGNLTCLTNLDVCLNRLSGRIPETLGNLSNLRALSLWGNEFSGNLPSSLGNLTNLTSLRLYQNQFSGNLPSSLGNLTNLTRLHLYQNQFSGSLPSSLGNLTNLTRLHLYQNQFSGTYPRVYPVLRPRSRKSSLRLYQNQFSGSLPSSLGNLTNLTYLSVSNNKISGNLPSSIGNLTGLAHLFLHQNQFSGNLPSSLGNLTKFWRLDLSNNQFSGIIPQTLGNLSKLRELHLSRNQFSGTLPASLGNLTSLEHLSLNHNQFSGVIPETLGNLSKLKWLQLNNNQFSAPVPETLGRLSNLRELHLNHNKLSGNLPASLGNLTKLTSLKLYGNQLSGLLPASLGNLTALEYLWLNNNQFSGKVPVGVLRLKAKGKDVRLPEELELPENIGDIGDDITQLDLSNMGLIGEIPETLGNFSNLQRLYLNDNQLSGELRLSKTASFPVLRTINLSGNKLSRIDPRLFSRQLTPDLRTFLWEGNPLRQPPLEVLPRDKIGSDLDRLRSYADQVLSVYREVKLAIVGKENVGKTVLTHRLLRQDQHAQQHFDNRQSTTGVHYERWENPLQLQPEEELAQLVLIVWDYAGQQEYRGTHQCFFTRQAIYLLVFDLSDDEHSSATSVKQWVCDIQDRAAGAVFVLVGNKADLLRRDEADRKYRYVLDEARSYPRQPISLHTDNNILLPLILPDESQDDHRCCIVSCITAASIDQLRNFIVRNAIYSNRQRLPHLFEDRPGNIFEAIFNLGKESNTICVVKKDIQLQANVTYEQLQAGLQFWNDVGMCLCNKDSDHVFHDPHQVSEILKVLIDPQLLQDTLRRSTTDRAIKLAAWKRLQKGEVAEDIIMLLWANQVDEPERFAEFVLSLLRQLDLVVETPVDSGTYLVPLVLKPYEEGYQRLADIIPRSEMILDEEFQDDLRRPVFVLRVKFPGRPDVPFGLFERLLVRVYQARGDMVDDCDIPESEHQWSVFRDCLTDGNWFAIFVPTTRPYEGEITLRVNCRADGSLRLQSRCFAKRVWDELRNLVREKFSGVTMQAFIVLEDWKRKSEMRQQDLEHKLDDVLMDKNGFVQDPSERIPVITPSPAVNPTSVLQLWPQHLDRSTLAAKGHTLEFEKLRTSKLLGASRCVVYKGLYDGYPVAAKQFDRKHDQPPDFEFEKHPTLSFRTLLHAFGFCDSDDGMHRYLILEYAKYGSLWQVCHRKPVDECEKSDKGLDIRLPMRVRWLRDVIEATHFLHESSIIHRDIKCENIMLRADMTALLGDLGWAKWLSKSCARTGDAGTRWFIAPEVSDREEVMYSKPADIYSYGMTMVQLLIGGCPIEGCSQLEVLTHGTSYYTSHLDVLYCIAKLCTMQNPEFRPTSQTVCEWCNVVMESLASGRYFKFYSLRKLLQQRLGEREHLPIRKSQVQPTDAVDRATTLLEEESNDGHTRSWALQQQSLREERQHLHSPPELDQDGMMNGLESKTQGERKTESCESFDDIFYDSVRARQKP